MEVWPGSAYPLDATTRVAMLDVDAFVWHCHLPGVQPGTRYGCRVHRRPPPPLSVARPDPRA